MKRKRESKEPAKSAKPTQKPEVKVTASSRVEKDAANRAVKRVKSTKNGGRGESTSVPAVSAGDSTVVVLGDAPVTIQIVAGSYDRTLHGVTVTIPRGDSKAVQFADTFLFNAHTSAIRCLALSPPSVAVPGQGQKVMLATGSTDERINVYNLSAHPAAASASAAGEEERRLMATVVPGPVMAIAESSKNRELGTLLHHASTVTHLSFPTRSKLLSASEDSTIAVTRTRDWSLLSTIKAPVAKPGTGGSIRRPAGDTAAPGATPSGVNFFAVHPSMKVMLSVSRGERCMRLWNLVTGKKAGVLNFGRDLLRDLGEGKHAPGEGRQVLWGRTFPSDSDSDSDDSAPTDEFAIGFDRNVVVFGMDSLPRCKVLADARTKTHDFHYVEVDSDDNNSNNKNKPLSVLAVATEDGRILLCSTRPDDLVPAAVADETTEQQTERRTASSAAPLPCARLVGHFGGKALGIQERIKAFKVLTVMETAPGAKKKTQLQQVFYIVTAASTGALRIWRLRGGELRQAVESSRDAAEANKEAGRQVGQLLGTYQTPDRITCMEAFVMIPRPDGVDESEDEEPSVDEDEDEDEDDE
ncbi:60S ribosome biogenesis protein [Grosmannia clavigera kw1407]|uniref:60S ribosome biogenesis protein n=1 Tax=Grosmannia clavigera (strain kw1407 / UAMH 11150) TaxID=655863 RepID=F0XH26_GROCL|nr:60S ribosome biogenesis protein [Grosmannia clavigera kw1407]EFX02925.1 60S ribosome biogenesis protein [Grosmannia clavigera kw1407]